MIALDTNILIYCGDKRGPRRQQLALDLVAGTANGVLPWQVAGQFVAASRKRTVRGSRLRGLAAVGWSRSAAGGQVVTGTLGGRASRRSGG